MSAAVLAGCGGSSSPAPSPDPGGPPPIRGTERLGWDQPAADVAELNTYRYAVYVDGSRSQLPDILCANTAGAAGFSCSGRLPAMTPGSHTLELAAFVFDDQNRLVEGAKSAPLSVTVSPGVVAPAGGPDDAPVPEDPSAGREGSPLRGVPVAEQLRDVVDLGVDPEGRLLVGERAGVVRIVDPASQATSTALVLDDTLASGGTGTLLGFVLAPDFERSHLIYVLQTAPRREGLAYRIVRYRGVAGIFGERAVLLETGLADADEQSGTIRIGADGMLYAAIFEAPVRADRGELRGLILRLNPDGTTPSDQAASPVIAAAGRELRGLDWHPATEELWLAQDGGGAPARLLSVARSPRRARAPLDDRDYALPGISQVTALRFYAADRMPSLRGALLVAGEGGLHGVRFDSRDASRITAVERLLDTPLRAIAVGRDGTLFVATADAVVRAALD